MTMRKYSDDQTSAVEGQAKYASAIYTIHVSRTPWPAIVSFIIPMQGIWLICFMSLWLDPQGDCARDSLTITALLTFVAYGVEIKPNLPVGPNPALIEFYLFFYVLVCIYALAEYLLVSRYFSDDAKYNAVALIIEELDLSSRSGNAADQAGAAGKAEETMAKRDEAEKTAAVKLDIFSRWFIGLTTLAVNVTFAVYIVINK